MKLARRLQRFILAAYVLVAAMVALAQMAATYRHAEERLHGEIIAMHTTFGPGIADALWRFNDEILKGILDGMKAIPTVTGVRVDDVQGVRVIASGVTDEARSAMFGKAFSHSFDINHIDDTGKLQRIGRWTIYSNQAIILRQVEYSFMLTAAGALAAALALWCITLLVISRTLGGPLRELGQFIDDISIDNVGMQSLQLKAGGRHELHVLAQLLNLMTHKLRRALDEAQARVHKLETANEDLEEQLAQRTMTLLHLSETDPLTDLFNRRKLDQVLSYEIERLQRYGGALAIVMLDVDSFKAVNEQHGHAIGDAVLVATAALLRAGVRTADTVGRWDGEAFLIVCPHTAQDGALALAESLREQMAQTVFPVAGGQTCSFGVAQVQAGESASGVSARAEAALFIAKRKGRNRVEAAQGMLADAGR
jgi:diguanylate cyclase (GGDEF)-like protein